MYVQKNFDDEHFTSDRYNLINLQVSDTIIISLKAILIVVIIVPCCPNR